MLDPFTLLVTLTLTHLMAAVVLTVVWYVHRSIHGVGYWTVGRLCVTMALVVFTFRQVTPLGLSVFLGNAFLLGGLYFVWRGNLAFMGRPRPPVAVFVVAYGFSLAALLYWSTVEVNFPARSLVLTLAILIFNVLSFRALWPREGDEVYFSGKLLAGAFALAGGLQAVRLVFALFGESGTALMEPSTSIQVLLVASIAMSVLTAMANLAIIMEYLKKDLKRLAERDPLTGAYNRRAFQTVADHILARGRREGEAVSMVILDLDHFKSINDAHGHVVGDIVLKRVVDLVHGILRSQDALVRLGGEEFAMMLSATTEAEALHVAERIRVAIEAEHFETDAEIVRVTTSLGVSSTLAKSDSHGLDDLIKLADYALYQAKDAGRNRVCVSA